MNWVHVHLGNKVDGKAARAPHIERNERGTQHRHTSTCALISHTHTQHPSTPTPYKHTHAHTPCPLKPALRPTCSGFQTATPHMCPPHLRTQRRSGPGRSLDPRWQQCGTGMWSAAAHGACCPSGFRPHRHPSRIQNRARSLRQHPSTCTPGREERGGGKAYVSRAWADSTKWWVHPSRAAMQRKHRQLYPPPPTV